MQITAVECPSCGAPISIEPEQQAVACRYCGREMVVREGWVKQRQEEPPAHALTGERFSPASYTTTLLLAILLGIFGAHRFYTGHILIGVVQLLTSGGFLVWWLVDVFLILNGSFRDAQGRRLQRPEHISVWAVGGAAYVVSLFVITALVGDGRIALVAALLPAAALVTWLRRKENSR